MEVLDNAKENTELMKNAALITGALALSLCGAGRAMADTLLDLEDPPGQSNTLYDLSFIAGATTTDIQFAGYQVPGSETATAISLTSGGPTNLLGWVWTPTLAPLGSAAFQFEGGLTTGTYAVSFAGTTEDSFDRFDQVVNTVIGQTYDLNFRFTNSSRNQPSELVVSAPDAIPGTPEPASM